MAIEKLELGCCEFAPLPTVFGDELSYYETVCKLIEIVNGLIDKVNELEGRIRDAN